MFNYFKESEIKHFGFFLSFYLNVDSKRRKLNLICEAKSVPNQDIH